MDVDELYELAEHEGFGIYARPLSYVPALSVQDADGDCYIALSYPVLASSVAGRFHVAHEIGHCETDAFYDQGTTSEERGRMEYRADKRAVVYLVPWEQYVAAIMDGCFTDWEQADYWGVPEHYVPTVHKVYERTRYRACAPAVLSDYLYENAPEKSAEAPAEMLPDTTHENETAPAFRKALLDTVRELLPDTFKIHKLTVYRPQHYYTVYYRNCMLFRIGFDRETQSVTNIVFLQPFMEAERVGGKREDRDSFNISSLSEIRQYADRIVAAARDVDDAYEKQWTQPK